MSVRSPGRRMRRRPAPGGGGDGAEDRWEIRPGAGGLPAVVREGLVRLGHLVGVLTPLDGGAQAVGGVEDLVGEPFGHGALTAIASVSHEPADGEGVGASRSHLDGHLIGGATHTATLDLELRPDVLECPLERADRLAAEARTKIGKLILNAPADRVKTLYGSGVKPAAATAQALYFS